MPSGRSACCPGSDVALTGKQRRALRAMGHHLEPVVQVGHAGITPGVVAALEQALWDHELVKVKVGSDATGERKAVAAKLAFPDRRVLAAVGDGAFLMNSQELETAVRERLPMTVLVWQDDAYGLIKWKMQLDLGTDMETDFTNPDLVAYAESFGARGYAVRSARELLPTLREALESDTVSVIACPVDYSENLRLTSMLGELTGPF